VRADEKVTAFVELEAAIRREAANLRMHRADAIICIFRWR
jgi:hypothetical protein